MWLRWKVKWIRSPTSNHWCSFKKRRGHQRLYRYTQKTEAKTIMMQPQAKEGKDSGQAPEARREARNPLFTQSLQKKPTLRIPWLWTSGFLTMRQWICWFWPPHFCCLVTGATGKNAGCVWVCMLTYTAGVHGEGRHIPHVDPLHILNQQTEQRQVESGYPCLMALKQRHTAWVYPMALRFNEGLSWHWPSPAFGSFL